MCRKCTVAHFFCLNPIFPQELLCFYRSSHHFLLPNKFVFLRKSGK